MQGFTKKYFFPNCIGALDGKLLKFHKNLNSVNPLIRYKKIQSIVLFGLVDADLRFQFVEVCLSGPWFLGRNFKSW